MTATLTAKTVSAKASTPARPAAAARIVAPPARPQLQSLRVSSPQDAAEQEAVATARKVMLMAAPIGGGHIRRTAAAPTMVSPYARRFAGAMAGANRSLRVDRKAGDGPNTASNVVAELSGSLSSGSPLPLGVRRFMEPRFGADLSAVRVHTDDRSAKLNRQFQAQAFTVGNQIFFGKNQFNPATSEGKELIAHEVTHTVQQGTVIQGRGPPGASPTSNIQRAVKAAHPSTTALAVAARAPPSQLQRSAAPAVAQRVTPHVQRLGISDALDYFADKANYIPGFRMFTIILGVNPINMSTVDRSPANILRAVVEFMPGGRLITQALDNYGIFDRIGNWVAGQIASLGLTWRSIRDAIDRFLDSLSWTDIFDLGGVWRRAVRIFTDPIDRIVSFVVRLVSGILGFIRDAILRPLAALAAQTRGWDLLKAVLGRDPITGDPVPRNADTLIGGFMKLIGQEEVWNNIKRANAVARAWAWFQSALSELIGFVTQIPTMFIQVLQSLEITDLVLLPRAFAKVGRAFASFAGRFISWALGKVFALLEIIFEVLAPSVMPYLRRAAGAFQTIVRNPIGFIGSLVRAGILGFRQFATNFLSHLRTSLIQWLTGTLSGMSIYIPQAFSLPEILKFVLSVLGVTWQNIRQKLVRVIGETAVRVLETGFDLVMTLVTRGPAAAWQKIMEGITNLREMVIDQIMTFVRDRVVQAAITRLITSLNPAGAFIQAIIAIYNTIMFFIERLRQIAQVAASFIDSISAIASGVIATAANRVERTMAGLLTLVISFLARIAGLGRVSDAVRDIINRVRAPIDRALDRVVDWIVTTARRLGRLAVSGAQAAARRVLGWLGIRAPFTTIDGERHALYFEQRGGQAVLIRATDAATEVLTYLNTLQYPPEDPRSTELTQAKTQVAHIVTLTRTPAAGQQVTTPAQEAEVIRRVTELSRLMMRLVNMTLADLPPAADWSQRSRSATAHHSRVFLLSSRSALGGGAASGTTPEWEFVAGKGWVRMHLIAYAVGGRGDPDNWVPAPLNVNSGAPVRSFETAMETAVRSAAIPGTGGMRARPSGPPRPNVIWVDTAVTGYRNPIVDNLGRTLNFPRGVRMRFGLYRPAGTAWQKLDQPLSQQTVTIDEPEDDRLRLSSASGTAMRNSGLPHLSHPRYGSRLVDIIKDVRGSGFPTYGVLQSRLEAATARSTIFEDVTMAQIVADLRAAAAAGLLALK